MVSGGLSNIAGGESATVPGGSYNVAQGQNSLAAGQYAYANHAGAFVWADSSSSAAYYFSQRDHQFLVRAVGGVHFDVNNSRWVRCV